MTEGSVREIRKAEDAIADGQLDLDRLRILEDRVRQQLADAELRERRESAEAEHGAVAEAIKAHLAKTERDLPKILAPIRALLTERIELIHRARLANEAGAEFELSRFDTNALGILLAETMLPFTAAEKDEARRRREQQAEEEREIRLETLRKRQRENEEHAAREREREQQQIRQAAIVRVEDQRGPGLISSVVR
ncbi:hypothetical protein ACMS1Z_00310 [Acidiphilium multivorum]|uniref:hypothetical protein n=1 Tax=Acidiphilium multivorum TaxID=62140 RepID=UPI0039C97172